jgi:DNA polymerase-1
VDSTAISEVPPPPRPGAEYAESPGYLLVNTAAGLATVIAALDSTTLVGLDLETTGLNPRTDRVRLLSLACNTIGGGEFTYLIDCFAVDPSPLWELLSHKELTIHNAAFDLAFLSRLGFMPGTVHDTMLMARALAAGGPDFHHCSLKDCARRELALDLDKSQQKEDWSGTLSEAMLAYAARDALTHRRLYEALRPKVQLAGLADIIRIEERALPAFVWLRLAGVFFDQRAWQALAAEARLEADQLAGRLDEAAPGRPGFLGGAEGWDWNSPQQAQEAFRLLGHDLASTDDQTLAALDHPFAELLRQYRAVKKRVGTYGEDWLRHLADNGRIFADWNQLGSVAGRTSCSAPNLQQVPRDPRYRGRFVAPPGRVLVKADYSQLQLRIAAKVANEERMLAAYRAGDDLHTLTARQITGKTEVSKDDRQLAKAVNFGLLFGLGAKGLRGYARSNYGLDLTEDQARKYRRAFFAAYPGLGRWHKRAGNSRSAECRTLAGRRRLLDEKTPYTHRLNTPVQGTEADGAKLAMALLWERRGQVPGAFPVLFAHDEIVVECDAGQAEAVVEWLRQAMLDGMAPLIDPVPVEVETKVGTTWAGDPVTGAQVAPPAIISPATWSRAAAGGAPAGSTAGFDEDKKTMKTCQLASPLKYHGGKRNLASRIIDLMPPHLHYVEPYCGGGQVFFARDPADPRLLWPERTSDGRKPDGVSEVINDLYGDLMNLYAVLKDPDGFERLRHRLELTLCSEAEWEAARYLLAGPDGDAVTRAAAFFTFCRLSRSGMMKNFTPTVRTRLRGGRNDAVNAWWNAIDGLEAVHRRLKDVLILNRDALDVIRSEDGPATLFYCDPPYLHETRTAKDVYRFETTEGHHRQLLDLLRSVKEMVILSGYPSRLYDQALADWNRHEFDVPNNAAGGKVKGRESEVVWTNF